MIYHSFVVVGLGLIAFTLLAIAGSLKLVADALKAQNDYYGIFEQTSEEQEIGIDTTLPDPTIEERRG